MQQNESGRAYSFFGQIKVDYQLPDYEVVYQHETIHAKHLHSADVLLFEILTILNWFNPVIYFYRKAIKHNHEFIADQNAVSFGVDKSDYALLLLSQTMGIEPNNLVNSFFNHSLLKQRIMMLHKNPSRRSALLKYGLSAPLFAAMLILTSATVSKQETIQKISDNISSDATIREVAVNLSPQINVVPVLPTKLNSPVIIVSPLKGKVVDPNGEPLAGVKISYAKRSINITSDKDGNFKISNYNEGDIVSFNSKDKGYGNITKSFRNVNGKLSVIVLHPSIEITLIAPSNKDGEPVSFASVEKLPSFPGGEAGFGNFLAKSIRYPKIAKENKTAGRVIISFIVEKDGSLTNIKVLRDIGGGCGEEAIRVLSLSPAWNPGMQDGKPVRVAFTMPVNFTLEGNAKSLVSTKTTHLDSASNPELYKRGVELMKKATSVTIGGFGGPDSARQRKPSETIPLQAKMMGLNDPLYILDGTPIDKDNFSKIKPNDIESISVFKSTKAIERYGDKGKNGVIEITMKKGKKP